MLICRCLYNCKDKYKCHRFMTPPLESQANTDFSFGDIHKNKNGKCKYFIEWESE